MIRYSKSHINDRTLYNTGKWANFKYPEMVINEVKVALVKIFLPENKEHNKKHVHVKKEQICRVLTEYSCPDAAR